MEQVSFKLHSRMSSAILRHTSAQTRSVVEQSILFLAVCTFCVVNISHYTFCRKPNRWGNSRQCLGSIDGWREDAEVISVVLSSHPRGFVSTENCSEENLLYSYSKTQGFLLLDASTKYRYGISTAVVHIPLTSPACFGDPLLQRFIVPYIGADVIASNWFLAVFDEGFVYHHPSEQISPINTKKPNYVLLKLGVVLTSLFLFFVTTTLVRFTLLETQAKMLTFTVLLHNSIRERRPFAHLIFSHVCQSCVFIPIMLGTLFFLGFYFHDNVLAFFVLTIVWMCEVYKVLSMRTLPTNYFFPRAFFLYFSLFHIYFFSCPFGFHYWSLSSTILFLLHSMWFFYTRYELPALQNGVVSSHHPRVGRGEVPRIHTQHRPTQRSVSGPISTPLSATSFPSVPSMTDIQRSLSAGSTTHILSDEDDSTYYVYLNGEVVMHRSPSSTALASPGVRPVSPSETSLRSSPLLSDYRLQSSGQRIHSPATRRRTPLT